MKLPDPKNLVITIGVNGLQDKSDEMGDYLFQPALAKAVYEQYQIEPDQDLTGGTDKEFFVLYFRGTKLFAAVNEVNGLTVMLPEEY